MSTEKRKKVFGLPEVPGRPGAGLGAAGARARGLQVRRGQGGQGQKKAPGVETSGAGGKPRPVGKKRGLPLCFGTVPAQPFGGKEEAQDRNQGRRPNPGPLSQASRGIPAMLRSSLGAREEEPRRVFVAERAGIPEVRCRTSFNRLAPVSGTRVSPAGREEVDPV